MKYKYVVKKPTTVLDLLKSEAPARLADLKKQLKNREVKVNAVRVSADLPLCPGDEVEIFLPESMTGRPPDIPIVFRGGGVVVVAKPPGIETSAAGELLGLKPAHRLDRNTSGLLMLCETESAYRTLTAAMKGRLIEKTYLALVAGRVSAGRGEAYLKKDAARSLVAISDAPLPGYLPITTEYEAVRAYERFTLVKIRLITGRTHQIRAYFAHIGHPVLGDGKYGDNALNRSLKVRTQQLIACRLRFGKIGLPALDGKTVRLPSENIRFGVDGIESI